MARKRGKCTLKKDIMNINRNNYENFFLLYLDGELNASEQAEVENFLNMHGDLKKEFSLLQYTIQQPSEIIFEPKEMLYRKEEKRRVIPIFWTRIAASLLLILAGAGYLIYHLNGNKPADSVIDKKIAATDAGKNYRPVISPAHVSSVKRETVADPKSSQDFTAQKKTKKERNVVESIQTDDFVMQKSGVRPEIQTSINQNNEVVSGQLANTVKTPSLTVAVVTSAHGSDAENKQPAELTRDNAISVIALNDQNKGITSFFKKIVSRMPGNETAENTKKLRVSVFQFSY
jgi:hypothetical protein